MKYKVEMRTKENLVTEIEADSHYAAERLAEGHFPDYRVETCNQIHEVWNGITGAERRLWFGIPNKGCEAPWMGAFGACLVKIWDIRRSADGAIEYGIGNEDEPAADEIGWVTGDKFAREWSQ